MESLGSLLNGVINYNSWLPEPSMYFEGIKEFFAKLRAARHRSQGRSARLLPAAVQLCHRARCSRPAVNATKSLDQKALAKYLHENEHKTIVGPIAFSPDGERKVTATLQAQFRGVVDKNLEQFKTAGKQVILFPDNLKTGEVIVPFETARK